MSYCAWLYVGSFHPWGIHQISVMERSTKSRLDLVMVYLGQDKKLKEAFLDLNSLSAKAPLYRHKKYKLPIYLYNYNGKSIRSTIGIDDWDKAVRIKKYNEALLNKGLRSTHFIDSKILWVPFNELTVETTEPTVKETILAKADTPAKSDTHVNNDPLYGGKYSDIEVLDNSMKGQVFYVVSGHGGPDPGARCTDCKQTLCEDEYAYDVSLRLARNLRQHGATVEMVIQDKTDGIRDASYLKCDSDEQLANGSKIPVSHLKRLQQRTDYINKRFTHYKSKGYKDQSVISIHIDSNSESHQQDVFFCYYPGSNSSKELAIQVRDKFQEKYDKHQKNRGYKGYLHKRNFYVLRKTAPPAILIELANIQNKHNHKRILNKDNRLALANWIYEGLLNEESPRRLLASN